MTRRTRTAYLAATSLAVLVIGGISVTEIAPRLIWNASASVPVGLYALRPVDDLTIGDLVAVTPPEPLAQFITARGYVGPGVPLLKHVAALPGQKVCRVGSAVTVDGIATVTALARDSRGRDLPVWRGCRVIGGDEILLLNPGVPDSLDGRYFGPLPATSVIGCAIPLWLRGDGDRHRDLRRTPVSPPHRTSLQLQPKGPTDATDRRIHSHASRLRGPHPHRHARPATGLRADA